MPAPAVNPVRVVAVSASNSTFADSSALAPAVVYGVEQR